MQVTFTVWAPLKKKMQLHLQASGAIIDLTPAGEGYWQTVVPDVPPDARYYFRPDGKKDYPDPASFYQPEGVHGPSQVVDHAAYKWQDAGWQCPPMESWILYELHVGAFTPEGTFEAVIPYLGKLKEVGINAIELLPVSQFPGSRNWGYDGVYPYAVQNSYGGPQGLKKLVDACHQQGIAVILDVVYNHMGPEGNYLSQYGPYFTHRYHTPWGDALNFDDAWSDGVRDFFADNAFYWLEHFHIDGLRCDAIHEIYDRSAIHFWELLHQRVKEKEKELGRAFYMIAESDLNSPHVIQPASQNGFGFDAQWLDDFHHILYVFLNPQDKNRYYDFTSIQQLAKAYNDGFVHSGEWVKFRKRQFGASSAGIPGSRFVAFNQNHDQTGNRVDGGRISMLTSAAQTKLAAATLLLSPYIPMLFMGEEWGATTPFYYFVSHSDKELVAAVRKGRKEEFAEFGFEVDPPDPQAESTFIQSKLNWEERDAAEHQEILAWYRQLIALRQAHPALKNFDKNSVQATPLSEHTLLLERNGADGTASLFCLFHFSDAAANLPLPFGVRNARLLLASQAAGEKEKDSMPALPAVLSETTVTLSPWCAAVYEAAHQEV